MKLWTMLIYGVAAVLALQALFTLMTAHRKRSLSRFFDEELRRKEAEAAQAPEPPTANAGQNGKAVTTVSNG